MKTSSKKELWDHISSEHSFAQKEAAQIGQWNFISAFVIYQKKHHNVWTVLASISFSLLLILFFSWYIAIPTGFLLGIAGCYIFRIINAYKYLQKFNIPLYGNFKEQFIKTAMFSTMSDEDKELMNYFINTKMEMNHQFQKYNFFTMNYEKSKLYLNVLLGYDEVMNIMNLRRKNKSVV